MKIIFTKIIEEKIKEIDFSKVQTDKPLTKKQTIKQIKEMFKFEDDKTLMKEMIKQINQ